MNHVVFLPRPRHCLLWLWTLLSVLFMTGCGDGGVTVYVDNGTSAEVEVKVDEQLVAKVPSGEVQWIRMMPGSHRVVAISDGRVLYSATKTIEPPKWNHAIVFNPDGNRRYATCKIEYGHSALKQSMRDLMHEAARRTVSERASQELSQERYAIARLLADFTPLPNECWVTSPVSKVLEAPPNVVLTRSSTQELNYLTRVNQETYDQLLAARDMKRPTEADVERLAETCSLIAESAFLMPKQVAKANPLQPSPAQEPTRHVSTNASASTKHSAKKKHKKKSKRRHVEQDEEEDEEPVDEEEQAEEEHEDWD